MDRLVDKSGRAGPLPDGLVILRLLFCQICRLNFNFLFGQSVCLILILWFCNRRAQANHALTYVRELLYEFPWR